MSDNLDWIYGLRPGILKFLDKLRCPELSGYYSYSLSGDIYDPQKVRWGLGNTVFAVKTYYMLNAVDEIGDKAAVADFIKSFQSGSGQIHDPLIERKSLLSRLYHSLRSFDLNNINNEQTRIAETRQAFAALSGLGEQPSLPYKFIAGTKDDIKNYILKLNWARPWGAASHFSHLIFFLKNSPELYSGDNLTAGELIDHAFSIVDGFRQDDGGWYRPGGFLSQEEKVNGAMKMMLANDTAQKDVSRPEKLIDLALSSLSNRHACDNFNIVCVIYHCSGKTGYKKEQIMDFCAGRLLSYRQYYWPEHGGFSFNKGHANRTYYGSRISKGLAEPDIHGTHLYLWGTILIARMLRPDLALNFKAPIT